MFLLIWLVFVLVYIGCGSFAFHAFFYLSFLCYFGFFVGFHFLGLAGLLVFAFGLLIFHLEDLFFFSQFRVAIMNVQLHISGHNVQLHINIFAHSGDKCAIAH